MISHTIPAAGVAGVIKVALALYHRVLPPTLNCDEPNPKLELEQTPFYINTETRPWIHGGPEPRRAGVNAFGFGGINAHAVLEEVAARAAARPPAAVGDRAVRPAERTSAGRARAPRQQRAASAPGPSAASTLDRPRLHAQPRLGAMRSAAPARGRRDARSTTCATKLGRAAEKLARAGLPADQGRSPGSTSRPSRSGRDGQGGLRVPRRGRAVPEHARRPLPALPGGARGVRRDRPPLRAAIRAATSLSDWVFPRPAFSDAERRRAEERLMQMDIAVESVLTANRRDARAAAPAGLRAGRDASATAPASTPRPRRGRRAGCRHRRATPRVLRRRCTAATRRRPSRARPAARRAAGAWYRPRAGRGDRARGRRRAARGDGQLPASGRRWSASRRRSTGRASSPLREGIVAEELPYDRAVHTPLFAPLRRGLARASSPSCRSAPRARRCGRARPRRPTRTTRQPSASCWSSTGRSPVASARRSRRSTTTAPGCSSRSVRAAT